VYGNFELNTFISQLIEVVLSAAFFLFAAANCIFY